MTKSATPEWVLVSISARMTKGKLLELARQVPSELAGDPPMLPQSKAGLMAWLQGKRATYWDARSAERQKAAPKATAQQAKPKRAGRAGRNAASLCIITAAEVNEWLQDTFGPDLTTTKGR